MTCPIALCRSAAAYVAERLRRIMALGYVDVEPEAVPVQQPQAPVQEGGDPAAQQAPSQQHADTPPPLGGLGNGLYAGQEDHVSHWGHPFQSLGGDDLTALAGHACLHTPGM